MQIITAAQIKSLLDWEGVVTALFAGHQGARPMGDGYYIGDSNFGLFSRGVILPGRGAGFKVASIYPDNHLAMPRLPTEQASFIVLDEQTKGITAILDGPEITRWKTAADSVVAANILSRQDSEVLLVIGAGPIATSLIDAYLYIRPSIKEVLLWNRTQSKLTSLHQRIESRGLKAVIVEDLDAAVARADIITSATSMTSPVIHGKYVRPGTHIDLVGGYRPEMQEADADVLRGARIFVDDRQNAANAGDIQTPLRTGVIKPEQIEGDLFDLCQQHNFSRSPSDRTVFKNAGGAHIDLIVSLYVLEKLSSSARACPTL